MEGSSISDNPAEAGFSAGVERVRYHFEGFEDRFEVSFEVPDDFRNQVYGVLESWPERELSDGFVTLFAESAAVAHIVRIAYNDTPLNEDELRAFLGHSASFFNSFKHRIGESER